MARPPLPLGQHGAISVTLRGGRWVARARVRGLDGVTGTSRNLAAAKPPPGSLCRTNYAPNAVSAPRSCGPSRGSATRRRSTSARSPADARTRVNGG